MKAHVGAAFFTLSLFFSCAAFAGALEELSRAAFSMSGKTCQPYNAEQAATALIVKAGEFCSEHYKGSAIGLTASKSTQKAMQDIAEFKSFMISEPEDKLFALLARKQAEELDCAQDFSKLVSQGKNKELNDNLKAKLELARQAKANLVQATQKLATDPAISARVCPLDMQSLKFDYPGAQQESETFKTCAQIITHRQAYSVVMASIPLSGSPEVRNFVEQYASSKNPSLENLSAVYKKAGESYAANAAKLRKTLAGDGAVRLTRNDRYELLKDPALSEQVISEFPEVTRTSIRGLVCEADARYGKGAEALDTGLTVGSLVFSGGVGLLAKTGLAAKSFVIASRARSTGTLTLNSMHVMQASALALDSLAVYSATDKACRPSQGSALKTANACSSAPQIAQINQDNCILTTTLAALGYAAVLPGVNLGTLKGPPAIIRSSGGIQGDIWLARNQGNVQKAEALESQVSEKLTSGKITKKVRSKAGITQPYFVTYSDGTEGVWKRTTLKNRDADKEVAAYKVDRELGMNIVPVTVKKKMDDAEGSVQVMVTDLRLDQLQDYPNETALFDYLIANNDRHRQNYLQTESGKVAAIDHGFAFHDATPVGDGSLMKFNTGVKNLQAVIKNRQQVEKQIEDLVFSPKLTDPELATRLKNRLNYLKKEEAVLQQDLHAYMPSQKWVEKLRGTTRERWQEVLGENLKPAEIDALYTRQQKILKTIDDATGTLGADKVYSAGPRTPVFQKPSYSWGTDSSSSK